MGGKASIIRVKNKYYTRGAGLYQRVPSCQTHAGRGRQEICHKKAQNLQIQVNFVPFRGLPDWKYN